MTSSNNLRTHSCYINAGFSSLQQVTTENDSYLQSLNLHQNSISLVVSIERFKRLQDLNLSSNELTDMTLQPLKGLKLLQKLDVSCNRIASMDGFPRMETLRVLLMSYNRLESLSGLSSPEQKLPNLQELDLRDNKFSTMENIKELRHLPRLQVLHILSKGNILCRDLNYFSSLCQVLDNRQTEKTRSCKTVSLESDSIRTPRFDKLSIKYKPVLRHACEKENTIRRSFDAIKDTDHKLRQLKSMQKQVYLDQIENRLQYLENKNMGLTENQGLIETSGSQNSQASKIEEIQGITYNDRVMNHPSTVLDSAELEINAGKIPEDYSDKVPLALAMERRAFMAESLAIDLKKQLLLQGKLQYKNSREKKDSWTSTGTPNGPINSHSNSLVERLRMRVNDLESRQNESEDNRAYTFSLETESKVLHTRVENLEVYSKKMERKIKELEIEILERTKKFAKLSNSIYNEKNKLKGEIEKLHEQMEEKEEELCKKHERELVFKQKSSFLEKLLLKQNADCQIQKNAINQIMLRQLRWGEDQQVSNRNSLEEVLLEAKAMFENIQKKAEADVLFWKRKFLSVNEELSKFKTALETAIRGKHLAKETIKQLEAVEAGMRSQQESQEQQANFNHQLLEMQLHFKELPIAILKQNERLSMQQNELESLCEEKKIIHNENLKIRDKLNCISATVKNYAASTTVKNASLHDQECHIAQLKIQMNNAQLDFQSKLLHRNRIIDKLELENDTGMDLQMQLERKVKDYEKIIRSLREGHAKIEVERKESQCNAREVIRLQQELKSKDEALHFLEGELHGMRDLFSQQEKENNEKIIEATQQLKAEKNSLETKLSEILANFRSVQIDLTQCEARRTRAVEQNSALEDNCLKLQKKVLEVESEMKALILRVDFDKSTKRDRLNQMGRFIQELAN